MYKSFGNLKKFFSAIFRRPQSEYMILVNESKHSVKEDHALQLNKV